jgi:hypothetical protein
MHREVRAFMHWPVPDSLRRKSGVPPSAARRPRALILAALLVLSAAPARAQLYESVGIRAQGMAGAFVAVADDATAAWWNPAGLATGAYFNGLFEYGTAEQPRHERDPNGQPMAAWRSPIRGVALAFPALGLSYYRLQINEMRPLPPTAGPPASRQDQGAGAVRLRTLVLNQFGATAGQSLGNHLVIGTTLKLVRGTVGSATVTSAEASLDRAAQLAGDSETHADLDAGALATFRALRAGVSVRNLRAPAFGTGEDRQQLRRQARAGVAVVGRTPGLVDQVVLALDADLTRTATAVGEARYVAGGLEVWTLRHRVGARAGVSANTIGDARTSLGGGLSFGVRAGTYVEAQLTAGSDQVRRGWGLGLRVTY